MLLHLSQFPAPLPEAALKDRAMMVFSRVGGRRSFEFCVDKILEGAVCELESVL